MPGSGMIFLSSCDLNNNIIWIRERNYPTGFLCKKNYPTISVIPPWDELSCVVFRGNFCHGEAEICYASLASLRSARSAHLDKASRQAILEKLSARHCARSSHAPLAKCKCCASLASLRSARSAHLVKTLAVQCRGFVSIYEQVLSNSTSVHLNYLKHCTVSEVSK